MYKLVIILRYLRRKLTPMFAALAVTLCSAMVIIVISIMGGFLENMRSAARTLEGDIIIQGDLYGFPHYEALIAELDAMPQVVAATANIKSYGLVNISDMIQTVEVVGIEPQGMEKVVHYRDTLYWTREHVLDDPIAPEDYPDAATRETYRAMRKNRAQVDYTKLGMAMAAPAELRAQEGPALSGIVMGIHVSPYARRYPDGRYDVIDSQLLTELTLTLLPVTSKGTLLEPAARKLVLVNEFKTGLYAIDANRVYIPFNVMQKMLGMDAHADFDPDTGQPTGRTNPARATTVILRGRDGVPLPALKEAVTAKVEDFAKRHRNMRLPRVMTWEEKHATFLGAVLKEKFLVTILFAFISIVAVVMIAVIFYMIVLEKTRDIGVLRAIGASWRGIMGIFLGYGLAIGVVGAFLGFWLAAAVVWNINGIQTFLTDVFGVTIWNPEVYYFDQIPNRMNPTEVTVILAVAVVASVLGSVIPAVLAAMLNPVEALRYE
ncbi:MAG: FtsX-like permease family protein [Phycisphaeraceae bacterium]